MQKSSKMQSIESSNKQRADHLALSVDNLDFSNVTSFIDKYGPLQLVGDRIRSKQNRVKVRKITDNCSLMSAISLLVNRTNSSSGDPDSLKRLEAALQVDKRLALPHPSWTSRHDAILVLSVFKHGWIDQSSSFRAIADDNEIKWGPPFEVQADVAPTQKPPRLHDIDELRATASRASAFINKNRELIGEYKGFNHATVKRAYGLCRSPESESGNEDKDGATHSEAWVVDDSALIELFAETTGNARQKPEDLPSAKDLLRRAKLLLNRCAAVPSAASESATLQDRPTHEFPVLDQSNMCNILLAEMLRGLVKAKTGAKDNKKLCQSALQEATNRVESIKSLIARSPAKHDSLSKSLLDMELIVEHIGLVQRNLKKSVRQFKNVLRVILGLEVDPGRNTEEGLFPVEKAKLSFPVSRLTAKGTGNSKSAESNKPKTVPRALSLGIHGKSLSHKTTGEIAIENAQKKLSTSRGRREENGESPLELTEIEILILSMACSKGLPVWRDDFGAIVSGGDAGSSDSHRPYALTWAQFGSAISENAKYLLELQKAKVNKIEDLAAKSTEDLNDDLRQRLEEAEALFDKRERAFDQSDDYARDPETLAKKTVMMIAKIREVAVDIPDTSPIRARAKSGIMKWLRDDLRRWGKSLDLLDDAGDPFPLTAVDFMDDVGEEERSAIEVSALMNKGGCLGVMEQVALMSRLRSVFLHCERGVKQRILEGTVQAVSSSLKTWDAQPEWWGSRGGHMANTTLHHDQLLLERLMHSGFDGVVDNKKSYGVGGDVVRVVVMILLFV